MCLIAVAWKTHPQYALVVAANRDEFYDRPTAPAQWWAEHPDVFGGRDLRAGGSWMAVSRSGRFAALTNVRRDDEPVDGAANPDRPSRGRLVEQFVTGNLAPAEFVDRLLAEPNAYAGFNLLAGDGDELWWCDDLGQKARLDPGVHTLSNASLDTPWPKTVLLQARLTESLDLDDPTPALFDALADRTLPVPADVPPSTLPAERARQLAACTIVTDDYGTRASTVTLIGGDRLSVVERTLDRHGVVVGESSVLPSRRAQVEISGR
jgi:uncharacterized protein with NRDE domain